MTSKQPEALQYADRDRMALGDHYLRHVSAMTGEALHAKSAIAAELAHRDREIDGLHAELEILRTGYDAARLEIGSLKAQGAQPAGAQQPGAALELLKFYGVTTDAELIAAQARHIERLQARLPQPPSFAPQRVREG